MENAREEIAGPKCIGGKCRTGKYVTTMQGGMRNQTLQE